MSAGAVMTFSFPTIFTNSPQTACRVYGLVSCSSFGASRIVVVEAFEGSFGPVIRDQVYPTPRKKRAAIEEVSQSV
jgi:hypothetical protein